MAYLVGALIFAVLIILIVDAVVHLLRDAKKREAAELTRIAALPDSLRAEVLFKARVDRAAARTALKAARARFNRGWGYRHNPAFSSLIVAQAIYDSATTWLRKIEALCASNQANK